MRILITSWGWPSHYFPMVPIGWAFRAAGHEVRVVSQPGLMDTVTASGLPGVPVGEDIVVSEIVRKAHESVAMRGREWRNAPFVFGPFLAAAEAMLPGLLDFVRAWQPDLIVYEHTTYAAPMVGRITGVPVLRHLWGPDLMVMLHDKEPALLASLCERHGLDGIETYGDLTLDPCPPSMQLRADYRRQRMQYVPYNGSGVAPDWLLDRRDRPRVCVTMGTMPSELGDSHSPVGTVLSALEDFDVVLTGAGSGTGLPGNVRPVKSIPLNVLLPTCDLMIHHGGPGTMMTGVACGVPQLILPSFLPEQPVYAGLLARQGAGLTLAPSAVTRESVVDAVNRLLGESSYREAAQRLRAVNQAAPSLAEAVQAVTSSLLVTA